LPLMVFFAMLDARFVAPLIKSPICLLPSRIHWSNMKVRGRHKRTFQSWMSRKEIGAIARFVNTKKPSFSFCMSTCYCFTWKWKERRSNLPHCSRSWGGHPMVEYESRKALYSFINVHKNPKMHLYNNLDWIMAMYVCLND
jgi:hypothetical protein